MADTLSGGGSFGSGGGFGATGTDTTTAPSWRKKAQAAGIFGTTDPNAPLTSQPLFQQTAKTAVENMTESPAFDAQANIARDAYKAAQAKSAQAQREQLMGFGMRDTGTYIDQGIIAPAQKDVLDRADLERKLATDRQTLMTQRQGQGMTAATNLIGVQSTAKTEADKLTQNASQFASSQDFQKWATEQGWNQDAITRAWQASENQKGRTSTETIAYAGLNVEEKKLAQDTWKFSTQQDYNTWALQQGFTQDEINRNWQAGQAELNRKSTENIAFANLSFEEKKLAQDSSQFETKTAFDKWALQQNLDSASAARIWQSNENDKQITATQNIALLSNNMELYKTNLQADLTRQGWSEELSRQYVQIQADSDKATLDRALSKYIADNNLSIEDKKLSQQAAQFQTEQAFKTWATQAGLDDNTANRAWQANQNAIQQAAAEKLQTNQLNAESYQKELDRSLTASIESGRIAQEDKALVQNATQFASKQEFDQWALTQNLDATKASQIWQSAENAKDRAQTLEISNNQINVQTMQIANQVAQFSATYSLESSKYLAGLDQWNKDYNQKVTEWQAANGLQKAALAQELTIANAKMANDVTLATLDNQFKLQGISLESILNNLGNLPSDAAAATFIDVMNKAGLNTAGVADQMKTAQNTPVPIVIGQEDSPTLRFTNSGTVVTPDGDYALASGQKVTLTDNFVGTKGTIPKGTYTVRMLPGNGTFLMGKSPDGKPAAYMTGGTPTAQFGSNAADLWEFSNGILQSQIPAKVNGATMYPAVDAAGTNVYRLSGTTAAYQDANGSTYHLVNGLFVKG